MKTLAYVEEKYNLIPEAARSKWFKYGRCGVSEKQVNF